MGNTHNISSNLQERLDVLRSLGYSQLRIPGGTALEKKHFSAGVLVRKNAGVYEALVVPYNKDAWKHQPQQSANKQAGETPLRTLEREFLEETGLTLDTESCVKLKNATVRLSGHTKYFFKVGQYEGQLLEFSGANKIDPETAAPLWLPIAYLANNLFPAHIPALKEVLSLLAMEDREAAMLLFDF